MTHPIQQRPHRDVTARARSLLRRGWSYASVRGTLALVGALAVLMLAQSLATGQTEPGLRARVAGERAAYLETLRELVSIESGSSDVAGLTRIGELIAGRLRALGGEVEMAAPAAAMVRFENTPPEVGKAVVARFRGTGTRRILLLAHMDTVYPRGMLARQPFRVDGGRAYGLGIADDKHGVALILHTLSLLKALGVRDYGLITVLINADEEVSSVGSRALITQLGAGHDLVMSFEGAGEDDSVRIATQGIAAAQLKITGRASHAGAAPEQGRNALIELAHQMLQTSDLSNASIGTKMNWTLASAGSARNVIPALARATADVRVVHVADYDAIERRIRERIRKQRIPDVTVELVFERTRPPMEPTALSRRAAEQARRIYAEIGADLKVHDTPNGGGTDAAFAALEAKAPVIEGFGLKGFGAHSDSAEYVEISSIEPRLYLATRMIMEAR
jgi:glutamate carboxypeptidase